MVTTEPNAAAADPAADLVAYLHAMRLDDPSSSLREQRRLHYYPAPTTPLPPPQPLQVPPVPAAAADAQFQAVRQYWPQSYGVGESSTGGAGYVSPYGSLTPSSFFTTHFGAHSPRFITSPAAASPLPSVAATLGHLSAASASHYDPSSSNSSSTPSSSTSHYCQQPPPPSAPQLAAGTPSYPAWYLDPFSALLSSQRQVDAGYGPWIRTPAASRFLTREEVRSRLLSRPMEPALVIYPETARHVVRLLQEGGQGVRQSVLAGVKRAVHGVMGSAKGHAVFIALLRACEGRLVELEEIVRAVCKGEGYLVYLAKHDHGVAALKELIDAVAPYHYICEPLIVWLLQEGVMEQNKGEDLLYHCFTSMPYENCSVMISFAVHNIDELFLSASGSRCLAQCFVNARNGELHALEEIVLRHTSEIARGQYSNYFLQKVLEWGSDLLRERVAERVAEDAASLSADQFGSYVVETCFLRSGSPAPAQRVLAVFLGLRNDQLAELVQGSYSNYVVHKLLTAGKDYFPEQAAALARRIEIERLRAAVQRDMHAQRVMRVIKKLFPRKPRYQPAGCVL